MKTKCFFLSLAAFVFLLCTSGLAFNVLDQQAESYGTETLEASLPKEASDVFGTLTVTALPDMPGMLQNLWTSVRAVLEDQVFSALRGGAVVLLAALTTAICAALTESDVVRIAGVAAVSLLSVESVTSCAAIGRTALESMTDFSHVLLPCLCTAAAAGGAVTSAGAKYAASVLFLDGLVSAELEWASVFLCSYAGVLLAGHLAGNALLLSLAGLMKQGMKWILILLTLAFTLYLSLTGILNGTVDASAAKTAKAALSSALPVVGGIVSDASSALLAGAQMLRNGIGVLGMLAVCAVCVTPYLMLGSHYIVYQLAGSAAVSFGDKQVGGVIKGLGDIYGMLLGMVGSVSLMLFVSVVSLMQAVSPG